MLNRSLTTQLVLTLVASMIWLLYVAGRRWFMRHQTVRDHAMSWSSLFYALLTCYAVGHILFIAYAWINRVNFPLNLETMELLKLQHVKRLLAGLPIYVEPSAEFIPLVYNPLYYYLVIPFTRLFGLNLTALRVASIVGAIGAYLIVFLAVRQSVRQLGSRPKGRLHENAERWWLDHAAWWGLMAVGLMAAAFRVMDTYLDNAAADSWTLLTILLGCYLISLRRGRLTNLLGVLALLAAFWLKQYGALFTIAGVCYLAWSDGWRRSWPYWLAAILLGPLLYLLLPPQWLGPEFHYYTWEVPKQWMYFSVSSTLLRVIKFIIKYYAWLALTSGLIFLVSLWRQRKTLSIWYFMLPFALLSGPYVALDPGNNNNVFIPLGTWLIILGVLGIYQISKSYSLATRWGAPIFLLAASFALFSYNPATILIPATADRAYADLVTTMANLDGDVYAPGLGQLQDQDLFYPEAHWVTLIDLIRSPDADLQDQPLAHELLEPVVRPDGPAYILLEHPLEEDAMLAFLAEQYTLETDFGNRYIALRDSPKLLEMGWPTYLYRYTPEIGQRLEDTATVVQP